MTYMVGSTPYIYKRQQLCFLAHSRQLSCAQICKKWSANCIQLPVCEGIV